jgi:hypothetical protein
MSEIGFRGGWWVNVCPHCEGELFKIIEDTQAMPGDNVEYLLVCNNCGCETDLTRSDIRPTTAEEQVIVDTRRNKG